MGEKVNRMCWRKRELLLASKANARLPIKTRVSRAFPVVLTLQAGPSSRLSFCPLSPPADYPFWA